MKQKYILLFTLAFLLIAMYAYAAVVTVTPESMGAWSIETNKGGEGAITTYGPAAYETSLPFQIEGGASLGRGAFYARCPAVTLSDNTPATVWLGTDMHNGQSLAGKTLSSITKMEYYSYVSKYPSTTYTSNANWDSWKENWRNPWQPIQIQITAEDPNNPAIRRTFAHRPWGNNNTRGDNNNENVRGTWQFLNPKTNGKWIMHPDWEGLPYTETIFANWDNVIQHYGSWKLVATSTSAPFKSAGFKGNCNPPGRPWSTATGKCLNLEVGARFPRLYLPSTTIDGLPVDGGDSTTPWSNWGTETVNFTGHIDYFTLGVNNVDETYNFEPSASEPLTPIVHATNKSVASTLGQSAGTKRSFLFKIAGKVVQTGNLGAEGFPWCEIDDGSGTIIRVYNTSPLTHVGDYYSSWGLAEWPRFTSDPSPTKVICLWTHKSHSELLHEGGDVW